MDLPLVVQIIGILVALAVLFAGFRKLDASRPVSATLAVLDVLVLVASVAALGLLGLLLAAGATVLAVILWSIKLAMQKEEYLAYAATQARTSTAEMDALWRELKPSHQAFALLGPLELARLISLLSQRARSVDEIRAMALPIAMLWTIHRPNLTWLVERFDRVLRLYDKPASAAMETADVLTVAAQQSAASFEEVVDGVITAVDFSRYAESTALG